MKKIWKYVVITLLLLLGLCCVGILYLFFVPGSQLFNITYINYNVTKESSKIDSADISTITINSRAYDVDFVEAKDETVSVKVYSNSFGFVLKKNKDVVVTSSVKNNHLNFTIIEPHGFATANQSKIEISLPTSKTFNLNLVNYKASVTMNLENLHINNLNYSTQKGDMSIKRGNINGELNLNLSKGTFNLSKSVSTNNNNVNLSLSTGKFLATETILGDVTILNNARGTIKILECATLKQSQSSSGGQINVTNLGFTNISAGDTIISINTINNGAIIDLTKSGNVTIKNLTGVSSITTKSGNIKIENANSDITLKSDSGKITVNSAFQTVSVNSNTGNVTIHFAETAPSYTETNQNRILYAKMRDGSLTATGVENVGNYIDDTDKGIYISGSCKVNLRFNNIYGNNKIYSENGSLNISINKDSSYILTTSSKFGYVRVNLTQIVQFGGYTSKEETTTSVNCSSSVNSLVTTSNRGSITILDTNFS